MIKDLGVLTLGPDYKNRKVKDQKKRGGNARAPLEFRCDLDSKAGVRCLKGVHLVFET